MRRSALMPLLLVAVVAAGCGGSSNPSPSPKPRTPAGEAIVRSWTTALAAGQVDRAAGYFAPGAIVQQVDTLVLRTHADAVAFNGSLPCSARVTGIVRERGGTLLASFALFKGRLGGCPKGGRARVRFRIRGGLIESWRQLPAAPAPQGQST